MQTFLKLNLQVPEKKPEAEQLPRPEGEQPEPGVSDKRLNRMANQAAHKAAKVYGRSGSGLFSK